MRRKSSRVKVEDVLDNCLLFGARELTEGGGSFCVEGASLGTVRESAAFNVERLSSSAVASELAGFKGFEG